MNGLLVHSGLTAESAFRVGIVFSIFLAGIAATLLLIGGSHFSAFPGMFLVCWLFLSPSVLFTAIEFPKIFSSLAVIPFWFLPLAISRKAWPVAIFFAVATVALHRATLPWAAVFLLTVLILTWRPEIKQWRRWALPSLALTGLAVVYLFYCQDRFRLVDLSRLSWEGMQPGIVTLLSRENLPRAVKLELLFAPLVFAFAAWRFWRGNPEERRWLWLPLVLIVPAVFPFGSEEVFGAGERYAIGLPFLLIVGMLFLQGLPATKLREDAAQEYREHFALGVGWGMAQGFYRVAAVAGVILAFAAVSLSADARLRLAHPLAIDPPFAEYEKLVQHLSEAEIPMLIARKGIVFYYKQRLKREAFPYEPETHWDQTRIWRVLSGISAGEINYFSDERCNWNSGLLRGVSDTGFFVIREDCWQDLRKRVMRDDDPELYERVWELNPAKPRPAFLYAKHRDEAPTEFPALPPEKPSWAPR